MSQVPFSADEFFGVFVAYNQAVWPAPVVLMLAAVAAAILAFRRNRPGHRWVIAFLAVLWAWTGVVYHLGHFRAINPAAVVFGALFVGQAALFLVWAVKGGHSAVDPATSARAAATVGVLVYALVIYPLLVTASGHGHMATPTFGTPCPVVIYTFGLLLLVPSVPVWLFVIPVLWSIIGSTAVFAFGVHPDAGLFVSALVSAIFSMLDRKRASADVRRARPTVNSRTVQPVPSWRTRAHTLEEEA